MFNVLLIDRSNPVTLELVRHLAQRIGHPDIRILLLSGKEASRVEGRLEIVNVRDVPQRETLDELQKRFDFSLHKALVPERAFFDYSSFRRSQRYSDMSLNQVYEAVTPYVNALDWIIRERADLILEGLQDNFLTTVAGKLAQRYGKQFFITHTYYWWNNAFFYIDRLDQTSSIVDARCDHYMRNPSQLDRAELDTFYGRKAFHPAYSVYYTFRDRMRQLINRHRSYEPFSPKNWIARRLLWQLSKIKIKAMIRWEKELHDERFILFPLHVSPEAVILGNIPEIADQFSLIKNISMNLPVGVLLYVKEHPAQPIGAGLDYDFYRRVKSLPNVRLYSPKANAAAMYTDPRCLGVAVMAGTVGLEAALKRKPVFVFGKPLYGHADCFIKPIDFDDFFRHVKQLMVEPPPFNEKALYAMLQALREGVTSADVDLNTAPTWRELNLLGNEVNVKFVVGKHAEWQTCRAGAKVAIS